MARIVGNAPFALFVLAAAASMAAPWAFAQSANPPARVVSTVPGNSSPKPGVSFISSSAQDEVQAAARPGVLPTPPHLRSMPAQPATRTVSTGNGNYGYQVLDNNYSESNGAYSSGGYTSGYAAGFSGWGGGRGRPGYGNGHDHDHDHDGNHGPGGRPGPDMGRPVTVQRPIPGTRPPSTGAPFTTAPSQPGNGGRGNWQPGTGQPATRGPQPGTGMQPGGWQPGTGH
ncbi:hypothetical protein FHW69_000666 [Luteibacter sp. Sphag1AF]|uniref:hypothetical protein n=1 Tax=Luteibacter sp. Sphag1AF TaxID=2587031 RepID=UPI00161A4059|nr:hypothetical protein [Luteibacter sp. Sphag1AF]MBB3226076.1 hypothetical protein [Luteibacter sp. Sphag1AF]